MDMKLTKAQSKRLRYICGVVDYNQPCVKKYTGGPEGKIREIGKFKYTENGDDLIGFEFNGNPVDLSMYEAEEFLSALADDSGFCLGEVLSATLPSADTDNHGDIETAVAMAVEHQVQAEVPPATDDWMDGDGNDPDSLDQGTADIPELLTEEEKKAAEEDNLPPAIDNPTEVPPVEITEHAFTKEDAEKSIEDPSEGAIPGKAGPAATGGWMDADGNDGYGIDQGIADTPIMLSEEEKAASDAPEPEPEPARGMRSEEAIREIAMTAAARDAARLCGKPVEDADDTSVDIVRMNYSLAGFMDAYSERLKKVGMAFTLTEIADALPEQRRWIFDR